MKVLDESMLTKKEGRWIEGSTITNVAERPFSDGT